MSRQGFSFMEVMVAMVVLSMSLIVLHSSQTNSIRLVRSVHSINAATALASAKMAEITREAESKGITSLRDEDNGEFDREKHPGYRWKYSITKVSAPNFGAMAAGMAGGEGDGEGRASNAGLLEGPLQMITDAWGESLRELHVAVTWREGTQEKSVELATQLISTEAIAQIEGMIGAMSGGIPK